MLSNLLQKIEKKMICVELLI